MKPVSLLEDIVFKDEAANIQPMLVDESGRVMRFALKPGQKIKPHRGPQIALLMIVLRGRGLFRGEDDTPVECGPGTMLVFEVGELHGAQALDEELVFLAILRQTPAGVALPHGRPAGAAPIQVE
ncbi:MAG: cupin domain-containing protein [Anaerolineales bacterium]|nr:cupin domain-containing protein [Anaerolineales bacterium]MCW5855598.1 cupin domain-containing protein [Anaerolineales bacterium]